VTKQIAESVAQTATATKAVATGMTASATTSEEITHKINRIDQAMQKTAQGALKSKTTSDGLCVLTQHIKHNFGQVRASGPKR
jgi:methyl-accepting chemotaxis protein